MEDNKDLERKNDSSTVDDDVARNEAPSSSTHEHRSSSGSHSSSSKHGGSGSRSSSGSHSSSRSHSGSGSRSSSGSHSSSSSRDGSGSRSSSGSHSSSRGRSGSGSRSSSGSRRSSSRKKKKYGKLRTKLKRTKYKLREQYHKYVRRFKKASLIKQIGYVIVFISILLILAVAFRFLLVSDVFDDFTETTTVPTTAIVTEKPPPDVPELREGYALNDTRRLGDSFRAGFEVRLPALESEGLYAASVNEKMAAIRDDIKSEYARFLSTGDDAGSFNALYRISYDASLTDTLVFVGVYRSKETLLASGKVETEKTTDYYSFDYLRDKEVANKDVPAFFKLSNEQIINTINAYFIETGNTSVNSTDGITYYVRSNGWLFAQVPVESLNGDITYSQVRLA